MVQPVRSGTPLTQYRPTVGIRPFEEVIKSPSAPPSLAGPVRGSRLPSSDGVSGATLKIAMNKIPKLGNDQRGPEMQRILRAIAQHHPADERAGLLRSAVNEVKCLPPIDEDYPQPTNDQIKAFNTAAHVMENAVDPREWPKTLIDLKEAVELACVGAEWLSVPSGLQPAVNYAKIKWPTQDTSHIFWKLHDLDRRLVKTPQKSVTTLNK
jgi:hypothetical protein